MKLCSGSMHEGRGASPRRPPGCSTAGASLSGFLRPADPVSSHALAQGATVAGLEGLHGRVVSIHAPAHGATVGRRVHRDVARVSIHAPTEEATSRTARQQVCRRSFNPRSRIGATEVPTLTHNQLDVSIHAPAQGATRVCIGSALTGAVSIHAPAQEATSPRCIAPPLRQVSIHAPAQGATRPPGGSAGPIRCFNPRPRTGSDRLREEERRCLFTFQSTPPHRERRDAGPLDRTRAAVSIHAPAQGAT